MLSCRDIHGSPLSCCRHTTVPRTGVVRERDEGEKWQNERAIDYEGQKMMTERKRIEDKMGLEVENGKWNHGET